MRTPRQNDTIFAVLAGPGARDVGGWWGRCAGVGIAAVSGPTLVSVLFNASFHAVAFSFDDDCFAVMHDAVQNS